MSLNRARWAIAGLAAWLAGCGSSSSHGADAGGSDNGSAECGALFDAISAACTSPGEPADLIAHERARYVAGCISTLALPNYGRSAAQVQACADTIAAAPDILCKASLPADPTTSAAENAFVAACTVDRGSGAAGAPCENGEQCESGDCANPTDAGGAAATGCGTCTRTIAVGQPCATDAGSCDPGSGCDDSAAVPVCRVPVLGDAGAACDDNFEQCSLGLACDLTTNVCGPRRSAGATCVYSSDCELPLVCRGAPLTCEAPGQVGDACAADTDCVSTLLCSTGTGRCVTPSWVAPGKACGPDDRCEYGSCVSSAGAATGSCPAIVADGQACGGSPTTMCDLDAECIGGVCKLIGTLGCR